MGKEHLGTVHFDSLKENEDISDITCFGGNSYEDKKSHNTGGRLRYKVLTGNKGAAKGDAAYCGQTE